MVQFRQRAHEAVDYICDYYDRVHTFPVRSNVEVNLVLYTYLCSARSSSKVTIAFQAISIFVCCLVCSLDTCMHSCPQKHQQMVKVGPLSCKMLKTRFFLVTSLTSHIRLQTIRHSFCMHSGQVFTTDCAACCLSQKNSKPMR